MLDLSMNGKEWIDSVPKSKVCKSTRKMNVLLKIEAPLLIYISVVCMDIDIDL